MNFRYENFYSCGANGATSIFGRFCTKKDAVKMANDVLRSDPLKKGWSYAQVLDRQSGRVCAVVEVSA